MSHIIDLQIHPETAADKALILAEIALQLNIPTSSIEDFVILRRSMDARSRNIYFQVRLEVFMKGEKVIRNEELFQFQKLSKKTCHIIGMGPAGIYAALQCLEKGIQPIILERGKAVEDRISDISKINKLKFINPESNYCYGEGGAGTYSDGKLYTRSTKRGNVKKVLDTFIQHGADEKIGYEAHPHIGTNKLPKIIANIRKTILDNGGEIHFNTQIVDFVIKNQKIVELISQNGKSFSCQNVILATGHSARDIFQLLHKKEILIEAKPFALGVRIEHSQDLIDQIQYKRPERGKYLPPASYSIVTQACGRGVFSFCMCPGGVIASASTQNNEIVVNGWSSSARNGPYSNSGMVVEVRPENWQTYEKEGALAALAFQAEVESKAFESTGSITAPAQRVEDFIQKKLSADLPRSSYQPGLISRDLHQILPNFISQSLQQALIQFGEKMRAYRTNEAVLVGVESRSSSPVRIPRDPETLQHLQIKNLYPCGEGAGYAGGIVSAAMDGMKCADAIQ